MKCFRAFWNFIRATWKLERGSGCLGRFNIITDRISKNKTTEVPRDPSKVSLHETENCPRCGETFLSLYPFKKCEDHEGMDKI